MKIQIEYFIQFIVILIIHSTTYILFLNLNTFFYKIFTVCYLKLSKYNGESSIFFITYKSFFWNRNQCF